MCTLAAQRSQRYAVGLGPRLGLQARRAVGRHLLHAPLHMLSIHSFAWPREDSGQVQLSREQFDWLVAGLPWQRLSAPQPQAITVV